MTKKQIERAARKLKKWTDHWNDPDLSEKQRRVVTIEWFKASRALIKICGVKL